MNIEKNILVKGWCPSLERPMITGDGLLVRIPIKFGRLQAQTARVIAALSKQYGNGILDLSARGNLQLRGVSDATYEKLRAALSSLGFEKNFPLNIITSPLAGIDPACAVNIQEIVEKIEQEWQKNPVNLKLPEKFLMVVDGGGVFALSDIPADAYFAAPFNEEKLIASAIAILQTTKKCNKKSVNLHAPLMKLGFAPLSPQSKVGVASLAVAFGRMEANELEILADIADNFGSGTIILAPKRRILLPDIEAGKQTDVISAAKTAGFIVDDADSRLNIYVCTGAPACSSALGETRKFAQKFAALFPNLTQIVHITGCPKGCAYVGKADITITAKETGYDLEI